METLIFSLITESLSHRILYMGSPLGHVGQSTLPSSGHWQFLLWASINHEPFFLLSWPPSPVLALFIPHCTATTNIYDLSPFLIGSLPPTHMISLLHVPMSAQVANFMAQSTYFSLASYWFTLSLRVSQWEWMSWLANSLLFYIIP
jgi:hypothetical protein